MNLIRILLAAVALIVASGASAAFDHTHAA